MERNGNAALIPPKSKRKEERDLENVVVSWMTTPDALQSRPVLSSPTAFSDWMKSNGFLPEHPPGITSELIEVQKQQREFIQESIKEIQRLLTMEKLGTKVQENHPDWSKIYTYLGVLFETDSIGSDTSRTLGFGAAERQVIQLLMLNLVNNLSDENFCDQQRLLIEYFREQQELIREQRGARPPPMELHITEITDHRTHVRSRSDEEVEDDSLAPKKKRGRKKKNEKTDSELDEQGPASDPSNAEYPLNIPMQPAPLPGNLSNGFGMNYPAFTNESLVNLQSSLPMNYGLPPGTPTQGSWSNSNIMPINQTMSHFSHPLQVVQMPMQSLHETLSQPTVNPSNMNIPLLSNLIPNSDFNASINANLDTLNGNNSTGQ
uniref:Uncharacterized protein n=1 Tax=Arcella intermedia TaxID=1963864 RepID=A0A6B2L4W6_9EUKA